MSCVSAFYVIVWIYSPTYAEVPKAFHSLEKCAAALISMQGDVKDGTAFCTKVDLKS